MASSFRTSTLPKLCVAMAAIPFGVGIASLSNPKTALDMFEFQEPATPEGQKLAASLVRLFAWREVGLGLTTLAIWYGGDRKSLGYSMLALMVVVFGDGLVNLQQIGRGQWKHWFLVPVTAGLGLAMLDVI